MSRRSQAFLLGASGTELSCSIFRVFYSLGGLMREHLETFLAEAA